MLAIAGRIEQVDLGIVKKPMKYMPLGAISRLPTKRRRFRLRLKVSFSNAWSKFRTYAAVAVTLFTL